MRFQIVLMTNMSINSSVIFACQLAGNVTDKFIDEINILSKYG